MYRRWFAWLGFAAMAVAVLFIAADPASAQRFGRTGFYTGWNGVGYGNPYYGGYGVGGYVAAGEALHARVMVGEQLAEGALVSGSQR